MFPNLKFIRMFHIGRDSLVDSALTNNIFSKRKHACMVLHFFFLCSTYLQQTCLRKVKLNLSKFYDYAAMIRNLFFQPNLVCAKASFSEIWAYPVVDIKSRINDCGSYVFRCYQKYTSRLVV